MVELKKVLFGNTGGCDIAWREGETKTIAHIYQDGRYKLLESVTESEKRQIKAAALENYKKAHPDYIVYNNPAEVRKAVLSGVQVFADSMDNTIIYRENLEDFYIKSSSTGHMVGMAGEIGTQWEHETNYTYAFSKVN